MKKIVAVLNILLLAACEPMPVDGFRNPGDPEQLLDKSSERVSMSLGSRGALNKISKMIDEDPPVRAELNCPRAEALCAEAKAIFANHRIPTQFKGDGDGITLIYERLVVRDCDNRYVDNSRNSHNAYIPSLGCSVTGNMVKMVSDKRQFDDPSLMDFPDGGKAVQNYRRYQEPTKSKGDSSSLLKTITTTQ